MESPRYCDLHEREHEGLGWLQASWWIMEPVTKKRNVGEKMSRQRGEGAGGLERINHSVFTFKYFYFETPEENTERNYQVGEGIALARALSLLF